MTPLAEQGRVGCDRERALVEAVRDVLSRLGNPEGYFPEIGAPATRKLQRAFAAYEPHPQPHWRT